MTFLSLLSLLSAFSSPPTGDWFVDCAAAHRRMGAASVRLEVSQMLNGRSIKSRYDLSWVKPHEILMRIAEPEQDGRASSDRSFVLIKNKLYAYDHVMHERIERAAPTDGSLIERLSEALSTKFDDAVVGMMEAHRLEAFFLPFREFKDWKKTSSSGVTTLLKQSTAGSKKGTVQFRFDNSSRRLRGLRMDIPGGWLSWNISYSAPPRSIGFRPPAEAMPVAAFTQRGPSPTYANVKAKEVAERSMRAYDRLQHAAFRIEGVGTAVDVWISGKNLREDSAGIKYVWDRTSAAILDTNRKRFYSGKASTTVLLNAIAALGTRMDPVVKQIVTRENPVRALLVPGATVKHAAQVSIRGVPSDLVEFNVGTTRVSLAVRKDNGLLATVQTTVQDEDGAIVSDAFRNFTYRSVGKPIAKDVFDLKAPSTYRRQAILIQE